MKAALINEIGGRFEIEDVQIADPLGHEILVEIRASGLCHSDLSTAKWGFGIPVPMLAGHEPAGVVVAVGPDVRSLKVGDHVVASTIGACGTCPACYAGRPWVCSATASMARSEELAPRVMRDGQSVVQVGAVGAFAEQMLVHENYAVQIPEEIPFDRACLLGCGVATGVGAVLNSAQVRAGDTVAVIGCGGVGLNAVQGARLAGARRIIAIDLVPHKLELARVFGATDTISGRSDDVAGQVRELTGGLGVDHAFEVIGLSATLRQAVDLVRTGGTAYAVGMPKPGSTLEVDITADLFFAQKNVRGVYMGSTNLKKDIPFYADLYLQGRLNLDDLVSQSLSLHDINAGFEAMEGGTIARSVITF